MLLEAAIRAALLAILVFVLIDDLKNYRIRNDVVVALFVLFLLWAALRANLALLASHTAFALVLFAILALMYGRGLMGGGDVKLLGVSFLWLGPEGALPFALLMCGFTLLYWAGARLKLLPSHRVGSRTRVPFGPCIALAWIAAEGLRLAQP
ncbi:prepilin peptidase [Chelatococcus sp. SYSU_G07232]|uniref:Prepilin peptidase n=1 Tax=Chelatococcus albus TaxID=3047466 RepID=A0ABT7AIM5_9HYPH|nr:prepilin peptidase [Chelatococcus sp. SYSU_G07232]MDJ1159208.1 prepilin peptidase [Chelatococcus sp. SYSU_G07232]